MNTVKTIGREIFYKNTIIEGLDNQQIADRKAVESQLSVINKIWLGIQTGTIDMCRAVPLGLIINFVVTQIITGKEFYDEAPISIADLSFSEVVIIGPVLEEIVIRGIINNVFAGMQKLISVVTPNCIGETYIFQWIVSPSCRILTITVLFAAIHITNAGTLLSVASTIVQVTLILFRPAETILHETTGNLIAPIAAHMTNNFIVWCAIHMPSPSG